MNSTFFQMFILLLVALQMAVVIMVKKPGDLCLTDPQVVTPVEHQTEPANEALFRLISQDDRTTEGWKVSFGII